MILTIVSTTVACVGGEPTGTAAPTSTVVTTPATGPSTTDAAALAACATEVPPFSSEGQVPVVSDDELPPSDAVTLTNLSWDRRGGCERLTLRFVTAEGAPAITPPGVSAQILRDPGVLRLALAPEVTSTSWSTQLVETDLVNRAYVVRRLDGGLTVDAHLDGPAFARLSAESGPATLIVDLVPGGEPYAEPPVLGADTVIVSPTGGTSPYPLTIDGYVRNGADDIVTASIEGSEGSPVRSSAAIAPDPVAWEAFAIVFPTGPIGTVVLEVGPEQTQASFIAE